MLKTVLVLLCLSCCSTALYAQTILPRMSKHEVIDSLKAHHLQYTDASKSVGSGTGSSIRVERMKYDGMDAKLQVDFTARDSAAMVTMDFDQITEQDFYAYLSRQEMLFGKAKQADHKSTIVAVWMKKGIAMSLGYDRAPKQMAFSRVALDLMQTAAPR